MNRLVLGVIGHVDHGKTALVRALTGMETDRLAEEQARGISIALGFAHARLGDGEMDFIDMPGHERFVRTMVAGATGMDAVLLAVDAREGVMPQTREHVDIAALLGVERAVIAITRTDLASPDQIAASAQAALALATAAGLAAARPVPCSARTTRGLPELRAALAALLPHIVPCPDAGAPFLAVDRAFSLPGHGTVVTGTLRGGRLSAGDTIEIMPEGRPARIRALQVHGSRVAAARPGQRVAANLRGVEPAQVARGTALAAPGQLEGAAWITVQLRAVPGAPPLPTGTRLRLLFGTAELDARLRLLDREVLEPGQTAPAQLHAQAPICVPARSCIILRTASPAATLAGGIVLDPQAIRLRRHVPAVLAHLHALTDAAPAAIPAAELARAGIAGTTLSRLARLCGLGPAQATALLAAQAAITSGGAVMAASAFAHLLADIPRLLAAHPDGLAPTRLAALLPHTPPALLEEAATRLLAAGTLHRQGAALRLPRPAQDADQRQRLQARAAAIAATLRQAGLAPPDPPALAPNPTDRRLLDQLIRAGVVIRAPDRVQNREILFHRDAVDSARRRLAPLLTGAGLLVSEIGAALGISRKYSVPLLEHLDSIRFTRRVAERRVLANPD